MNPRDFFKSSSRLIRLAKKPGRTELWQTMKVCSIGILGIGLIGFVIKLLAAFIANIMPG